MSTYQQQCKDCDSIFKDEPELVKCPVCGSKRIELNQEKGAREMKQLLVYLLIGLAAGLLFFFFTQQLATNLKTSLQTLQDQQLQEQIPCEQPEAYQPTREQLHLIESYADIVTETEADYLEMMGHLSPEIRDQFPHLTTPELWEAIYSKELDYFHKHDELSQRIRDQIKESREQAEAIQRLFGEKEQR